MKEHEKIPSMDEEEKKRLYETTNRLLATVEFPPESLSYRLRKSVNGRFSKMGTLVSAVGLAIVMSVAKATSDHASADDQAKYNQASWNQNIDCLGRVLEDYRDKCYITYTSSAGEFSRIQAVLNTTPTPVLMIPPTQAPTIGVKTS